MVERIQICSNERLYLSPWEDNSEIVKLFWKYLEIFFSWSTGSISTNLAQYIPVWRGFKFNQMKGHILPQGEIMAKYKVIFENICYDFLVQHLRASFNQILNKASLGKGDQRLFKQRATPSSNGDNVLKTFKSYSFERCGPWTMGLMLLSFCFQTWFFSALKQNSAIPTLHFSSFFQKYAKVNNLKIWLLSVIVPELYLYWSYLFLFFIGWIVISRSSSSNHQFVYIYHMLIE